MRVESKHRECYNRHCEASSDRHCEVPNIVIARCPHNTIVAPKQSQYSESLRLLRSLSQNKLARNDGTGFTYIELIITLAIIAICFVPVTRMFSSNIQETVYLGNLITGMGLARQEMEKIKNLALTEDQIENIGDIAYLEISMNNACWHVERNVAEGSDPLEVRVKVFLKGEFDKPLVELVTLFEDKT